jgi:adenylate cyclase
LRWTLAMNAKHTGHSELTLMFTDIVGYSRLMGRDESLAIQMLGDYREILLAHIAHSGVFIEFAGDAIFARFDKALDAVNAAVAIQKHLQLFNQGKDKGTPLLQTRIGLHKGSVLLSGNAVLGDDVNIAARLEPLAMPDGICISKAVYDDVRLQLREPIKPLGTQSLKNIDQKIRAYLVKPAGIKMRDHLHYFWLGCSKKISAYRYPLIASLLLLIAAGIYFIPRWLVPGYAANYVEIANFQNLMNANGESDYFSAGITEAVRSQLADMRDVYLVEADKGIHAPIRLEGSVQKLGDNVRIAYRILRRKDNVQIAGGKLDGTYQDIFVLQDRLVGEIAKYLASEFKLQNFRPAPLKLTSDVTAYDYYLQGMDYLAKPSSQDNFDQAIQKFNEALVRDSEFALANAGICEAYRLKYESNKGAEWIANAESYCLRALGQDLNSIRVYSAIGALYVNIGKYSEAISFLKKAREIKRDDVQAGVALARAYDLVNDAATAESLYKEIINSVPDDWRGYQGYGYFLIRKGRHQEALRNYEVVLKLTPDNSVALNNIGAAYLYLGDFQKAAQSFELSTEMDPVENTYVNAGAMYYFSGDFRKSIAMYERAVSLQPDNIEFLVDLADAYFFSKDGTDKTRKIYEKARNYGNKKLSNETSISDLQFMALVSIYFGDVNSASYFIERAEILDFDNTFTDYVRLRMAIANFSDERIRVYVKKLLAGGYSEKLILADPYLAVLKGSQFKDLFVRKL